MRCPKLADLPLIASGKTGWPWDEECDQLPETMPDGSTWPRIGIVTPSYNQGRFIEETIRSVLLQGYPNLNYVIMDGGSGDNTVEIIKKYEPWLHFWKSGPDQGQTSAINEGWQMMEPDILAWLNSDDVYLESSFMKAALSFKKYPEAVFVYSDAIYMDENGEKNILRTSRDFNPKTLLLRTENNFIPQASVFLRSNVCKEIGKLDESLDFTMDCEYWLRIGFKYEAKYVQNEIFAKVRCHKEAKSSKFGYRSKEEYLNILTKYSKYLTRKEEREKYQKLLSETYYSVGNNLCLRGDTKMGRDNFFKSLKIRPLNLKPWPAILLSLIGAAGYRNLVKLYRVIRYD